MWAPTRRTAPRSALPVAVNPRRRYMVLVYLQAVGGQGGAGVVAQLRPVAFEIDADVGADQADRAAVAAAGGGEPVAQKNGQADLQAVGDQGGPGVVAQLRPVTFEAAADVGAEQADRAGAAAAGGGEPVAQENGQADLQAVGGKGGAGVVAQLRPGAVEQAADVGADQADRAGVAAAGGGEPAAEVHGPVYLQAVGGQGGPGVVAQLRPVAFEVAADVGAAQVDRAEVGAANDPRTAQVELAAYEPVSVQG